MQAGKLNRRVVIQQLAAGRDAIGQPVPTWSALATVWAHVAHIKGVQAIASGAETSLVKSSIRIRRRTDVTSGMRVLLGSVIYNIDGIMPDESSRGHIDLVCTKVGP